MAGIKRRLGSILGPEGRAPQIDEGQTTTIAPHEPARIVLTKTGEARYRVDSQVPRGLHGDPTAVANFGEAMATEIKTEGTVGRTALQEAVGFVPGVVSDGVTNNYAAIQAAANQGGRWQLPATTGEYLIDGEIDLTVPGTVLDFGNVKIRQGTPPQSTFRAIAPDCAIYADVVGVDGQPDFTDMRGPWEGSIAASRWAVVNIYDTAHRLQLPWIRGEGMSTVVRFSGWSAEHDAAAQQRVRDVQLGTLLFDRVEFGVAAKMTERAHYGSGNGRYGNTATTPRAPHALYLAEDVPDVGHVDPTWDDWVTYDGRNGHAYQFKGVKSGGHGGLLRAQDCRGLVNVMLCDSLTLNLVGRGDTYSASAGSITVDNGDEPTRVHITAEVEKLTDSRALYVINNNGGEFHMRRTETDHARADTSAEYDLVLSGSNNHLEVGDVYNNPASSHAWPMVTVFGSGEGNSVTVNGELRYGRMGIDGRNSPDAVFRYDPNKITLHPTEGFNKVMASAGGKLFISRDVEVALSEWEIVDDFTIGYGSGLLLSSSATGQEWSLNRGAWRAGKGHAYIRDTLSGSVATLDAQATNVMLQADITFSAADGLVFRAIDHNNYLAVRILPGRVEITDSGAALTSATGTYQVGRTYTLRTAIFDRTIDVWIDNEKVLSHTLNATLAAKYGSETRIGLRTSDASAQFRRFRAKAI